MMGSQQIRLGPPQLLKALFLFICAAFFFQDAVLPSSGLDPSWKLATQYGLFEHIDFGRYLIVPYGPLSSLTSRLFHPATWALTVFFELLCVFIALWPIVDRPWKRGFVLVLFLCVMANRIYYTNDGVVFAATFSAFLLALLGRRNASLVSAAAIGVLALAKTSFLFAAAPLFLLADLFGLVRRRAPPLQTFTLIASTTAAYLIVGQSLSSLPLYLRNSYELSKYYSGAMSLTQGAIGPMTVMPFIVVALGLCLLLALRARPKSDEPPAPAPSLDDRLALSVAALGLVWLVLVLYKASFVRFDAFHYYVGWNALLFILPVALFTTWRMTGASIHMQRFDIGLIAVAVAIFLLTMDLPTSKRENRLWSAQDIAVMRIREKVWSVTSLLGWLNPAKAREAEQLRVESLDRMAFRLPIGKETIDVYPYDIGNAIAAGLKYQPRPTMQSYLAYSPYLQTLDLNHWRSPEAPDHLLFQLADIDFRLPTLALGPSVVELLARYDAVAPTGPLLHLHKRAEPHHFTTRQGTSRPLMADEWIPVPAGQLVLAQIKLKTSVLASARAFLNTPPEMRIETQFASGEVRQYRFIPTMAELGFAISPDLEPLLGKPGYEANGLLAGLREMPPITAFRIRAAAPASKAFDAGTVSFTTVEF